MKFSRMMVAVLACAVLYGCGGGGSSDSSPTATANALQSANRAEGAYLAKSVDVFAYQFLFLENDDFYVFYGRPESRSLQLAGFAHGSGRSNNGTFNSTDAKDFLPVPAIQFGFSASYAPGASLTATASATGQQPFVVSATANTPATSSYDYNAPAAVADIAGAWTLLAMDGVTTADIFIATSGAFTGTMAGCNISGSITPRASGKNVFDVTVVSGLAPCVSPGGAETGIAISFPTSTDFRRLFVAGMNSTRTAGAAYTGTRRQVSSAP